MIDIEDELSKAEEELADDASPLARKQALLDALKAVVVRAIRQMYGDFDEETERLVGLAAVATASMKVGFLRSRLGYVSVSDLEANLLLFALDSCFGVDAEGRIQSTKEDYSLEEVQRLRDQLFAAHTRPED